jgi:hypothetical protein
MRPFALLGALAAGSALAAALVPVQHPGRVAASDDRACPDRSSFERLLAFPDQAGFALKVERAMAGCVEVAAGTPVGRPVETRTLWTGAGPVRFSRVEMPDGRTAWMTAAALDRKR